MRLREWAFLLVSLGAGAWATMRVGLPDVEVIVGALVLGAIAAALLPHYFLRGEPLLPLRGRRRAR